MELPVPPLSNTSVLRKYWTSPSFYTSLDNPRETTEPPAAGRFATLSHRLPNANAQGDTSVADIDSVNHGKRKFRWAPQESDVLQSMDEATPGTDGWAIKQGLIRPVSTPPQSRTRLLCKSQLVADSISASITPMIASFEQGPGFDGQCLTLSERSCP